MHYDKGLNSVNISVDKPSCVQNFLTSTGNETNNIFVIQGKIAISYNQNSELCVKRLNRGSLKTKYKGEGVFDADKVRNLELLRSANVRDEIGVYLPKLRNNDSLITTLISINRLCEELSLFKNMRKATNVWGKNLLQTRFVVGDMLTTGSDSTLLGNLNCMGSFLDSVKELDFTKEDIKTSFQADMDNYNKSAKYITEWLIYTNILDIIINFLTKGSTAYNQLLSDMPVKTGTKKFTNFESKLSRLDDVSVMLFSELLKSTQNLDVKEHGKQKKDILNRVFPFELNMCELEANTSIHTNVLKMMALLHAFIDTKNWGRLELVGYYRELLKGLINDLSNDHITKDELNTHREVVLNFHNKYHIEVNKVKNYSKTKENDVNSDYTSILEVEKMDFIAYRELLGTLHDMQKSLYQVMIDLCGETNFLTNVVNNPLSNY